ncbi:hypothetical protein GJ496_006702 [Pomphorhynchus laevis]|nr:hypothetical protein GJ496_006702 [Pomphorhynchus laevis]
MTKYDVIISGAGLAGLTLTSLLSKRCPSILIKLIDSKPSKPVLSVKSPDYSAECIAWNNTSKQVFEEIGIWANLEQHRVQHVKYMNVWDACSSSKISMNFENSQPTAYIIQNNIALSVLQHHVDGLDNVEQIFNCKIDAIDCSDHSQVKLNVNGADPMSCKLLVSAEGHNSQIRNMQGFGCSQLDYDCLASVVVMKALNTDPSAAYQRFLPNGPIASLPLDNDMCCVIWFISMNDKHSLQSCTDTEFVDKVNYAFSNTTDSNLFTVKLNSILDTSIENIKYVLNKTFLTNIMMDKAEFDAPTYQSVLRDTQRFFPIITRLACHFVKPRIVLIGDSAHRMHPLAGQGANVGIEDIRSLVNVISEQTESGCDIGEMSGLKKYERTRQPLVVGKALLMDGIYRLFSTSFTPAVAFRSFGITVFDRIRLMKQFSLDTANKG